MDFEKDVAIIGMACVFPQAPDLRRYWSNIVNGVDAIIDRPASRWRHHRNWSFPEDHEARLFCQRAGYLADGILFEPGRYGVLPNLVRHGDPDQFLMLHVIGEALADAGVAEDDPIRESTDVIIGRGGYATGKLVELALKAELYEDILQTLERRYPKLFSADRDQIETYLRSTLTPQAIDNVSTAVSNIAASRPANRFNLRGAAYIVDGACASSLLAVDSAVWRLRTRQSDMAVAAGMFLTMNPTFLYAFTRLGAVSPSQVIRPFDRRADGLLVGEGGGAVILKRLSDAIRDRNEIYAVIKGTGTSSDGREVDVLAPNPAGQILAVERAYADAGLDRDSIGYLEAHGTGTDAGDAAETQTIKTCFGSSKTPPTARAMGSVKSMIGHTMPAAGMASIIRVAMALSNKILPPSLHCEQPREDLSNSVFYINTRTRPWVAASTHGPRRAAINAFGFGGINAHVVLEETPSTSAATRVRGYSPLDSTEVNEPRPRAICHGVAREAELAAFSGENREAVARRIERVLTFLDRDRSDAQLADVCYSLAQEVDVRHPCKLALVVRDLAALRALAREALDGLGTPESFEKSEDIYYSESAAKPPGKIAFVFPGMGFPGLIGNYPDHLLELCLHYPEVRAEFDFFEERDRHPDDVVPTSSIFSPPASLPEEYRKQLKGRLAPPKADSDMSKESAPHERYLAAMGVTLANWVSWVLLRKFKVPVDMVTGQSQGEMAALCAVGVGDFHETAPSFWKVLDIDTRDKLGGRLAFAWASGERLEELVADHPGTYVAIYMAPVGTIFGGDRAGLERICDKLREEQVLVQILPYPPIHTPSLSYLKEDLTSKLTDDQFQIEAPRIPIYSSITASPYPTDPHGIRETLMYNVDRPLRIWQTIQRMYHDGARVFVQVGGGHMASHLEVLLPENSEPVVTAAMDTDTRNPLTQLCHLCATLFVGGVSIDLSPLFEYRPARALHFDEPLLDKAKSALTVPLRIDWMPSYSDAANAPPTATLEGSSHPNAGVSESANVSGLAAPDGEPPPSLFQQLPIDSETASRLPVLGDVIAFTPETSLVLSRWFDLETDPYLADHLFVYTPSKSILERLPVIPMTMSIEFAAEAASLLAPGMGLVGYENIRAMRWMGLKDAQREELRIEARVVSTDDETGVRRVETKFWCGGTLSFQAVVLLAKTIRHDLKIDVARSTQPGPWPIRADQIYAERYMFHGPSFHVFARLDEFGNPGASGGLEVLPKSRLFGKTTDPILLTDPCLMDGIGQIVGLWSMFHCTYILPAAADRIEIYGPIPPVGTICPVRIEVIHLSFDDRQIRCNVEIEDGSGNVWVRAAGWTEWIMNWSIEYTEFTRMPTWFLLGEELPLPGLPENSACVRVTKDHIAGADPEWQSRILLGAKEMAELLRIEPLRHRKDFLRGRAALKDAIRVWWSRQYGGEYPFPHELVVVHDERGAPHLDSELGEGVPYLSVSHKEGVAVAVASSVPVGIDIEPADRDVSSFQNEFLTPGEIEQVAALSAAMPEQAWPVRFWCAKEAVGKMLGTGLEGRPKQFIVVDVEPTGTLKVLCRQTGESQSVSTLLWNEWVFAYCSSAAEATTSLSHAQGELVD